MNFIMIVGKWKKGDYLMFFYDIFFVFRKFCKIVNVKKYYLMEMYGIIKFFLLIEIFEVILMFVGFCSVDNCKE